MNSAKTNYVAVGGFVLAGVAGLVVAVALLTGRTGSADTYYTAYDNVTGIKYGTQVLFEGFPVGQVEAVRANPKAGGPRFAVELSVKSGWTIPDDSLATIAASGLLAAVSIDIKAGASPNRLKPGADLKGSSGANVMSAMSQLASEMGDLSQNNLRPLLTSINKYVDSLGAVLEATAPALLRNMRELSDDLAKRTPAIIASAENFSGRLDAAGQHLLNDDNLKKLDRSVANTDRMASDLAKLATDLVLTRQRIDQLLDEAKGALGDSRSELAAGMKDLGHTLDVVARNIDSVTHNLDSTSRNMNEFSRHIRENPGLLLGGKPPRDEAARPQ